MLIGPRVLLRAWQPADRGSFAALNADPRVAEHLPGPIDRAASDAFADRIDEHHRAHGFGLWALELPGVTPFAGFVGLAVPRFEAAFTPCVEIGWRLAHAWWGRGYATEAARLVLRHGFGDLGLEEIVSFTVPANRRSIAVMERLGMRRDTGDDFEHPALPEGDPLRPHVLYRLRRAEWEPGRG